MAALPVMEGKAALFAEFAGIDAVPVVVDAHDFEDIVAIVRAIATTYGGINLEDFSAPRCFAIEEQLQDIGIPVLHDDQHGTAIVLFAALRNAARCLGRSLGELSVVINGAGAAGRAIAHLLTPPKVSQQANAVEEVIISARHGKPHSRSCPRKPPQEGRPSLVPGGTTSPIRSITSWLPPASFVARWKHARRALPKA